MCKNFKNLDQARNLAFIQSPCSLTLASSMAAAPQNERDSALPPNSAKGIPSSFSPEEEEERNRLFQRSAALAPAGNMLALTCDFFLFFFFCFFCTVSTYGVSEYVCMCVWRERGSLSPPPFRSADALLAAVRVRSQFLAGARDGHISPPPASSSARTCMCCSIRTCMRVSLLRVCGRPRVSVYHTRPRTYVHAAPRNSRCERKKIQRGGVIRPAVVARGVFRFQTSSSAPSMGNWRREEDKKKKKAQK